MRWQQRGIGGQWKTLKLHIIRGLIALKGQKDLFDFIGKPEEQPAEKQLLYIVDNPVTRCVNCVCQYCVNNAEELWNKVLPNEVMESCFNCDECREFTGDSQHKVESKKYCDRFCLSDYGAARNRKHIKVIRDGGKSNENKDNTK